MLVLSNQLDLFVLDGQLHYSIRLISAIVLNPGSSVKALQVSVFPADDAQGNRTLEDRRLVSGTPVNRG